ncbi:MAG: UDP-glucose/GDP-mannose dehydrogenase family protein, partial [Candidatus Eremiobacteraeota bacterium]|nr:UDP-glucose/GDP-mannose dehydrogenase family protein [Candidatus Eremiobacteraeota bacterium]
AAAGRLTASSDFSEAAACEASFIIVPTPSDRDGAFSNDYVCAALEALGRALRARHGYHVVVVTSTVMPGSMDGPVRSTLERSAERSVGQTLGLAYNPEFVALGNVVHDMLHPDLLLIGESDERAGALVASVYEKVCESKPAVRRMNFVNAELTKISVNTFVTTKISYANMIADICDRLPGADADVVAAAIGEDSRIGRKYLRGAIGYGGPCFPRDNVAFAVLAERLGARADLARATDAVNEYQVERLFATIAARTPPKSRIAVLGLAYKPDTGVIECSQGVMLARWLADAGFSVAVHDPKAMRSAADALPAVEVARSAEDALKGAALGVITTPWKEYARIDPQALARAGAVIDCWRILPAEASQAGAQIVWLGFGPQGESALSVAAGG